MPRLPARPFLYAVVDTQLLAGRPLGEAVRALCRGGAGLVQVRTKSGSDAERVRLAREAGSAARESGVPMIVNDRADVARIAGAAGVHVGQEDLAASDARAIVGPNAIVGVSTHDLAQAAAAAAEPVDYVAFGPVFATRTKQNPDPVVGLDGLRTARGAVDRPLVAIGGITRANAAEVAAAGADGVAVISYLLDAPDLEAAARQIVAALRGAS
ncbi:MAG TPA: thiamine phosphate synthase [Vicinamibacteria bacterium]|nr:thiamine phosphate synthase [Vicinamibacteria bacterium]